MDPDQAQQTLAAIRDKRRRDRKQHTARHTRPSRLDRFTGELLQLRAAGGSVLDLQEYLRQRRVRVHSSTVYRWLTKQEAQEDGAES